MALTKLVAARRCYSLAPEAADTIWLACVSDRTDTQLSAARTGRATRVAYSRPPRRRSRILPRRRNRPRAQERNRPKRNSPVSSRSPPPTSSHKKPPDEKLPRLPLATTTQPELRPPPLLPIVSPRVCSPSTSSSRPRAPLAPLPHPPPSPGTPMRCSAAEAIGGAQKSISKCSVATKPEASATMASGSPMLSGAQRPLYLHSLIGRDPAHETRIAFPVSGRSE